MPTGSRLCSEIIFLVSSGRSDSRIRLSHRAKAILSRSAGELSVSDIGCPLLGSAIADPATAIAKIGAEVTRREEGQAQSEQQAVVVLQSKQHAAGHFPGLERHDGMLVGGLHITQSAIEQVAGIYGRAPVSLVEEFDRLKACG